MFWNLCKNSPYSKEDCTPIQFIYQYILIEYNNIDVLFYLDM